jgi:hypothetical protein
MLLDVQFMVAGALALFAGHYAATATADQERWFHDMAELPLLPGTSHLCHRACPELMRERERLLRVTSEHVDGGTEKEPSGASPQELWHNPETAELQAVVQMVRNCEARMCFDQSFRQQGGEQEIEEDVPVEVPEPGVPLQFHSIPAAAVAAQIDSQQG